MSTANLHAEAVLSPQQSLLTDEIGNEVYTSHYAERKLSRFVIGTETVLLLGAFGLIFSLAHRPIANRYIRIVPSARSVTGAVWQAGIQDRILGRKILAKDSGNTLNCRLQPVVGIRFGQRNVLHDPGSIRIHAGRPPRR